MGINPTVGWICIGIGIYAIIMKILDIILDDTPHYPTDDD